MDGFVASRTTERERRIQRTKENKGSGSPDDDDDNDDDLAAVLQRKRRESAR